MLSSPDNNHKIDSEMLLCSPAIKEEESDWLFKPTSEEKRFNKCVQAMQANSESKRHPRNQQS